MPGVSGWEPVTPAMQPCLISCMSSTPCHSPCTWMGTSREKHFAVRAFSRALLLQDGEVCHSITHPSITHPSTVHPQIPSRCSSGALPALSIPAAPTSQGLSRAFPHALLTHLLAIMVLPGSALSYFNARHQRCWEAARRQLGWVLCVFTVLLWAPKASCDAAADGFRGGHGTAALSPRDAHFGCPVLMPPCSPAATWDGVFSPWWACSGEGKGKIRPSALGKPNKLHSGPQTLVTHMIPPCFLH